MTQVAVAQMIEDAVVRNILAAGIPNVNTEDLNLVRREMPERLDKDPSICCIVCVGVDRAPPPTTHEVRTNTTCLYEYPVLVVWTKKTAIIAPKADPAKKLARELLRGALFTHFLLGEDGVVRRCRYDPQPRFNAAAFQRDVKHSAQMFVYRTEENRVK